MKMMTVGCLGLLLIGCGGVVEIEDAGSAGAGGDDAGSRVSEMDRGSLDACETVCAEGGASEGCLPYETCVDHCRGHRGDWTEAAWNAFETCVATDPLCYQTIEGCMLPKAFDAITLEATGAGWAGLEGHLVTLQLADRPPLQTWVGDGAFGGSFAELDVMSPRWVSFVIDVDGKEGCTPGVDVSGLASSAWNGSWADPRLTVTFSPEDDVGTCPSVL